MKLDEIEWGKIPTKLESGANPAVSASSALCYTCPAGSRVRVLGVTNEYVRDGTGADVYARLGLFFGGATLVGYWPLPAPLTASVTWQCSWSAGAQPLAQDNILAGSLPCKGIEMAAGDIISIYWEDDQALDDALNPRVLIKEAPA